MKRELKEAIKIDLSQMALQHSPPIEANIQLLVAHVSTKESYAETVVNPSQEEHVADVRPTMGLYVQHDHSTRLVALGKVYEWASTIHNVSYIDDVVKVSNGKVYNGDAQVPFPSSKNLVCPTDP